MNKITEAGAVLIGGHSTEDEEPKFGLAVTGVVHPDRIWTNAGAQAGDRLILTKPIGSGVLFNANLKKWVSDSAMQECLDVITTLNRTAAEVMAPFEIHAATDITGFGLAGHGLEMARGSNVTLEIAMSSVPLLPEAVEMYRKGMTTGVNRSNRQLVEVHVKFQAGISPQMQEMVVDPQTSGGLLVSVRGDQAEDLLRKLHQNGVSAARIIGRVRPREKRYLIFF
jgi:selenide,water dikinase